MNTNVRRTLAAGLIAAVAIACGDAGMKAAGEMMEDAGDAMIGMSAAMMNASANMLDAGGQAMRSAGEAAQDAGDGSVAAQDSCDCTISGPIRSIAANDDPAQVRSGYLSTSGWESVGVTGPFLLTHLVTGTAYTTFGRVRAGVSDTDDCATVTTLGRVNSVLDLDTFAYATAIQGARLPVPAGKHLCFDSAQTFTWSGFHPYTN